MEARKRQEPDAEGSAYWAAFEGIPLCHAPRSAEESEALRAKGVCGPHC